MSVESVTTPVTTETATTQPATTTPPVATTQPVTTPTVPAHTPLEVEKVVAMSPAEYRAMQDQIADLNRMKADLATAKAEKERVELDRLKQKGEVDAVLKLMEQRTDEERTRLQQEAAKQIDSERARFKLTEERLATEKAAAELAHRETLASSQRFALDGELARALANGPTLVPGGAEQLTKLWRSEFAANPEGGTFAVKTNSGQTPAEFVTQQLARAEYSHFVMATNPTGGVSVGQTNQSGPTPAANPVAVTGPRNLGEAFLLDFPNGPPHLVSQVSNANANRDMTQSFGLRKKA